RCRDKLLMRTMAGHHSAKRVWATLLVLLVACALSRAQDDAESRASLVDLVTEARGKEHPAPGEPKMRAEVVRTTRVIAVGAEADAGLLVRGWSHAETMGPDLPARWVDGREAALTLRAPTARDRSIRFQALPYGC